MRLPISQRQTLSLIEGRHASTLDGADMNEHIRGAIVWPDEAEALLVIEKLYCADGHGYPTFLRRDTRPLTSPKPLKNRSQRPYGYVRVEVRLTVGGESFGLRLLM
jgi:hypothetical protein